MLLLLAKTMDVKHRTYIIQPRGITNELTTSEKQIVTPFHISSSISHPNDTCHVRPPSIDLKEPLLFPYIPSQPPTSSSSSTASSSLSKYPLSLPTAHHHHQQSAYCNSTVQQEGRLTNKVAVPETYASHSQRAYAPPLRLPAVASRSCCSPIRPRSWARTARRGRSSLRTWFGWLSSSGDSGGLEESVELMMMDLGRFRQ